MLMASALGSDRDLHRARDHVALGLHARRLPPRGSPLQRSRDEVFHPRLGRFGGSALRRGASLRRDGLDGHSRNSRVRAGPSRRADADASRWACGSWSSVSSSKWRRFRSTCGCRMSTKARPTPVTGFMTTGLKAAAFAAFVRVFISLGYGKGLSDAVQSHIHDILWVSRGPDHGASATSWRSPRPISSACWLTLRSRIRAIFSSA